MSLFRGVHGAVFCNGEWVVNGSVSRIGDIDNVNALADYSVGIFDRLNESWWYPVYFCAVESDEVRETRITVHADIDNADGSTSEGIVITLSDANQTEGGLFTSLSMTRGSRGTLTMF